MLLSRISILLTGIFILGFQLSANAQDAKAERPLTRQGVVTPLPEFKVGWYVPSNRESGVHMCTLILSMSTDGQTLYYVEGDTVDGYPCHRETVSTYTRMGNSSNYTDRSGNTATILSPYSVLLKPYKYGKQGDMILMDVMYLFGAATEPKH